MIAIRRARPADAEAIAAVHVATWRSAYPGILPDSYLAGLSVDRQTLLWRRTLVAPPAGHATFVAVATGADSPDPLSPTVVGFASGGRLRDGTRRDAGEIETLYVADDWRDRGVGRRLMRALAAHLNVVGCRSVVLWVLKENPSRWFYRRLGGRPVAEQTIAVGGRAVVQTAYLWEPIAALLAATEPTAER